MKRNHPVYLILIGVLLTVILFLTSCTEDSPKPDEIRLRALTIPEKKIIRSSNSFSLDLFRSINSQHPDRNVLISPFSVSTAITMTLNGANGETREAIMNALLLEDLSEGEINEAYKELVSHLLHVDRKVQVNLANSNWYRNNLTINENFEGILQEYYDAEVRAVDFGNPDTLHDINGWIKDKTNGKIADMLDHIPADALMYLINAIYFKADWQYQFDKKKTTSLPFHLSDGSVVNVPTMYSEEVRVVLAYGDGMQLIDIPYGNGLYAFTVILPDSGTDLHTLAETFTLDTFNSLLADTSSATRPLYLPKFKMEFKAGLNDVLAGMGMEVAFSDAAEFDSLFKEEVSAKISRILHQAALEVDEVGSEAAAATVVEIVPTSATGPDPVRIDRSFLFFIREQHSNTILFAGKLLNPD